MRPAEALRPHFLDIFYDIARYMVLLLVPLVRGLLGAGGSWLDWLAVFGMLLLGWLRWRRGRILLAPGRFCYARGLFFRKESVYRSRHLATICVRRPLLLRAFDAVFFAPVPIGPVGRERRPLIVSARTATRVQRALLPSENEVWARYRPVAREIAFFTALHSRAGAGLAVVTAFLAGMGRLLGRDVRGEAYGALAGVARGWADRLPPSLILIGGMFLVGYVFSVVRGLLEYRHFTVTRGPALFRLSGGVFPQYTYTVYKREISSIGIRFRLLTRLFGRFSLLVGVAGYGGKGFLPVLVPAARAKTVFAALHALAPECPPLRAVVRAQRRAWWGFLRWPCLGIPGILALAGVSLRFWPAFWELIRLWGGLGLLWLLWEGINSAAALRCTGLGATEQGLVLHYARRRAFYRLFLPYEKLIRFTLMQSPGQKTLGLCTVCFWERGSGRKHAVKGVSAAEVEALGLAERLIEQYDRKVI